MKRLFSYVGVLISGLAVYVSASDVLINSPLPWMTLRNDSLMVRLQADTAQLPQNQITFSVKHHSPGRASQLMSNTVTMDDYSGEFLIGMLGRAQLGGDQWLSIEWNVPGTEKNDRLGPVGIADLNLLESKRINKALRVDDDSKLNDVVSFAKDSTLLEKNDAGVSLAWNTNALFLMIHKSEVSGKELKLGFDPKCGKYAFLAWADRFISYSTETDSVLGTHYRRSYDDEEGLQYQKRVWGENIEQISNEEMVFVSIPWDELGLIPFEERVLGFAVFEYDSNQNLSVSLPQSAQKQVPGTWGEFILQK
ncbi:hypothetical protein QA601_01370 [Chitinispirillales bacterium ANBcel5]|uniref:hypothetical protein n=1 Tax=Cellulosispirillum alkaliphilum TaxID=3039283 RepID=UPI002A597FFA|nr:hypothetical protein [Chitinispirillales bacterium ANBcel5]